MIAEIAGLRSAGMSPAERELAPALLRPLLFGGDRSLPLPQFQAFKARGDAETDLSLYAHRLQRDGIVRTADQHVATDTDAERGAGIGADVIAGEIALPEPRHRREHIPGERGLLGDTDIETHFLDDGD